MLGTYTYQRLNYGIMVIFTTPYVLILFHLLGLGTWNIAEERLLDTGIGCSCDFGKLPVVPTLGIQALPNYMTSVLKANIDYLVKLKDMLGGRKMAAIEYKLVRKELYVSIANLSAAFHRMLSEPNKQQDSKKIYQFVVLNHVLSSNVASLASHVKENELGFYPKETIQQVIRTIRILESVLKKIDDGYQPVNLNDDKRFDTENKAPDKNLSDQLEFIFKVSNDIGKVATEIER